MFFSLVSNGSPAQDEGHDAMVPWWSFTKTVLSAAALSLVRDGMVRLMTQRLDAARLRYTPGVDWRYSNVGYLYVARLIERLTGLALEEALMQQALVPLGLSRVRAARTRADLDGVRTGAASTYDPRWVYHGLLVGPLSEAALFLDLLMAGHLLPEALMQEMQTARALGGPIPGRPWASPGYALGLMQGAVDTGLTLCGHTGAGPGSVVAVYRSVHGSDTATCAVFREGSDEGFVEAEVISRLSAALRFQKNNG